LQLQEERLVGVAAPELATALRAPMAVVIVLAAAATAGTRVLL
jgi:hypothetical protein